MSQAPATPKKNSGSLSGKTYSFEFLSYLYAAMIHANGNKAGALHKHMSALSGGTMTVSAVEHQLRPIKQRAMELNQEHSGSSSAAASPPNGTASTPASANSSKISKKRGATEADDEESTPTKPSAKKVRTKAKATNVKVEEDLNHSSDADLKPAKEAEPTVDFDSWVSL